MDSCAAEVDACRSAARAGSAGRYRSSEIGPNIDSMPSTTTSRTLEPEPCVGAMPDPGTELGTVPVSFVPVSSFRVWLEPRSFEPRSFEDAEPVAEGSEGTGHGNRAGRLGPAHLLMAPAQVPDA